MPAPTDISGLVHRFRASQVSGYTNGSSVSSAAFETGGVTLAQSTAGSRPTYTTSSINGNAGLTFNGSSYFMTGSVSSAVAQPLTMTVILKVLDATSIQDVIYGGVEFILNDVTPKTYGLYAGTSEITGGTPTIGNHAVTLTVNSGSGTIYVDGTQVAAGTVGSGAVDGYRIGNHPSAGRFFNGDICEIITYNKVLSAAERATIGSYVQSTYNISMSDATSSTTSTSRFVRNVDLTSLVIAASGYQAANSQTSSYTLVRSDAGKVIEMNVSLNNTVLIPANATVNFPVGTVIDVFQTGTGQTNIVTDVGVIVDAPAGTALRSQYATLRLRQRATNEWVVSGNTIAFYDPTTIGGLVHRMRASTIGISVDGTSVASAPFEVGGVTLTASGSAQPTWRARGVNGRPFISFDGVDDYLASTSGVAAYSQPLTICAIAQIRNGLSSQELVKAGQVEILLNQSANTWSIYSGTLVNNSVAYNNVMSFTAVFGAGGSQGSGQGYTNGTLTASAGSGGNGSNGGDIYIGTHPNTPRFLSADFYELLIYNQTMSASDLTKLHNYAQATYLFN